MRNLLLLSGFLAVATVSCESQTSVPNVQMVSVLEKNEFTFNAEQANITNPDVSQVLSQIPGRSASQMSHLSPGYMVKVGNEKVTVDLPYFGRIYNPSFDSSKNGLHFESKDFEIHKIEGKKGKITYIILPKDVQNVRRISVEMFGNGKAYVTIHATDRQPATYDGYITAK